ncbi:oligodendrocyte development [Branchiostoma belcheri]|nr:oligodendrocyte development [Branchiostoma belcheri]
MARDSSNTHRLMANDSSADAAGTRSVACQESNPRPLGSESRTLPLRHTTPRCLKFVRNHAKAVWTQLVLAMVTWTFSFLSLKMVGAILQYLFAIFSTLQGLTEGHGIRPATRASIQHMFDDDKLRRGGNFGRLWRENSPQLKSEVTFVGAVIAGRYVRGPAGCIRRDLSGKYNKAGAQHAQESWRQKRHVSFCRLQAFKTL